MSCRLLLTGLLFMGSCFSVFAAETGENFAIPHKHVVRLNRAPINKQLVQFTMPRPVETKLDNGLTVLVLEHHRVPKIYLSLWIKSGDLSDPKDRPGLAQFTAEMLREGTARRTSAQLSTEAEQLGASLGASAFFGLDLTELSASGLAVDADSLFDFLSDFSLHPTFLEKDFSKYQARKLADLKEDRSRPEFLAWERFHQAIYPDSPAAFTAPTFESIRRATRQELLEFHHHHYVPNNALLGIAGDISADQALALARKYFGSWKSGENLAVSTLTPPTLNSRVFIVDRPGSVQTNILAGETAVRRIDPDYIPLIVADHILGDGDNSRLFLDIREEKGYAYDISSTLYPNIYPGPWFASGDVRNAVTDASLQALLSEFRRLREEPVPEKETDEARKTIATKFIMSLEHPDSVLGRWMATKYFGLPDDYWDRYPREISKVNVAAVQRVAKKYLDPQHLQIVCVGDAKQILEPLKKYGPLEIYDADGNRFILDTGSK